MNVSGELNACMLTRHGRLFWKVSREHDASMCTRDVASCWCALLTETEYVVIQLSFCAKDRPVCLDRQEVAVNAVLASNVQF